MIVITEHRDQCVGILGIGKTGEACIKSLLMGESRVIAWEDSPAAIKALEDILRSPQTLGQMLLSQASLDGRLEISHDMEKMLSKIKLLVVSPGVPVTYPEPHPLIAAAKKRGIPISSDIQLLKNISTPARYIAITGTNGKSTTSALLGHIYLYCKKIVQIGGNIGTPALLLEPLDNGGTYILELSSFQLETLENPSFNTAIMLNLTPDHTDRYESNDTYMKAKLNIFNGQRARDTAIISVDHPVMQGIMDKLQDRKLIKISCNEILGEGVSVIDGVLYDNIDHTHLTFELGEIESLPGKHNAENIAAAYSAAKSEGLNPQSIIKAIKTFCGLPHRMQQVLTKGKLLFINDSKATNSDAAYKALSCYEDVILIAGGICKDNGIEDLVPLFNRLKHVYLVGRAQNKFAEVLARHNVPHTKSGNLEAAMKAVHNAGYTNGVVLLSPACSSLDQWKSFEERGEAFCKMVRELWE